MSWNQLKKLPLLLKGLQPTNDNLHRIAISNLQDHERRAIRWWCKKYRTPLKPLEDHTIEELIVEMLEDHYEARPSEIERFFESLLIEQGGETWNGKMSDEYERQMQQRLKKLKPVDISKYQSEEKLSAEEEAKILENLGRDLPKSRQLTMRGNSPPALGDGEFEDTF